MSTLKKILALSLALAMVLSVSAFAGNYTADTYQDVNAIDSGAAEAVEVLYALDIMVGNTNTATGKTEFRPNDTITRAEVAKMIYVILNYGNDDKAETYKAANIFADVTADDWFAGYVNYLAAVGMVQGDGTNFYPRQAVKTAEVAKMLLTAVGYKAEDHGYVGAGWSNNVLNDAYYIQLLDGYKANLNGDAPRQWVAVMFFNALMNAYTYDVTVPTGFTGYFGTDKINGNDKWVRFGYKYLGVDTFTAYAYATNDGYIDITEDEDGHDTDYASYGYVLFSNGVQLKGTGLGLADLGQQYRVVYNAKRDVVYSCCLTGKSVVAEAMLKDITAEVKYSTSGNKSSNSYYFTVNGVELPFATETVKAENVKRDTAHALTPAGGKYEQLTAKSLFDAAGTLYTQTVKVIDKDNDGDIDYVFVVPYEYGRVVDVTNSAKYGKSIEVEVIGSNGLVDLTYDKSNKLFVSDVIVCESELEAGNYVKYYYSVEADAFVMEVLPVVEAAEYTKRTTKGVFTFGDVDYQFAANGFGYEDNFGDMGRKYYGGEYDLVVDNGLLVFVGDIDDRYTTIDRINSKLVVVTDVRKYDSVWELGDGYVEWGDYTVPDESCLYEISYLDINGEHHTRIEYTNANRVDPDDIYDEFVSGWELLKRVEDGYPLFILHSESNGTVWCEAAVEPSDLYVSPSVVDDYSEGVAATVNTKKNYYVTADDVEVNIDPDAKMFFRNEDGDYVVSTLNEMADGTLTERIYQVYTLENNRGIDVTKAGYIDLCKYDDTGKDYGFLTLEDLGAAVKGQKELYNASIVLPGAETAKEATVLFADSILEGLADAGFEPEEMLYHYVLHDGVYTVEPVGFEPVEITRLNSNTKSLKIDGSTVYTDDDTTIALANWTVELKEAVNDLDEAAGWIEENFQNAEFDDISFIDFDEIPEEVVVGNDEDDTYFYVTFAATGKDEDGDELLYIVLVKVVIAAQDFDPWWN